MREGGVGLSKMGVMLAVFSFVTKALSVMKLYQGWKVARKQFYPADFCLFPRHNITLKEVVSEP